MKILWSSAGWADLDRLHAFLADRDTDTADAIFDMLADAPASLIEFPRRGPRLAEFEPREVRELRVGNYRLRYELTRKDVLVLRCFHVREDRF